MITFLLNFLGMFLHQGSVQLYYIAFITVKNVSGGSTRKTAGL